MIINRQLKPSDFIYQHDEGFLSLGDSLGNSFIERTIEIKYNT